MKVLVIGDDEAAASYHDLPRAEEQPDYVMWKGKPHRILWSPATSIPHIYVDGPPVYLDEERQHVIDAKRATARFTTLKLHRKWEWPGWWPSCKWAHLTLDIGVSSLHYECDLRFTPFRWRCTYWQGPSGGDARLGPFGVHWI